MGKKDSSFDYTNVGFSRNKTVLQSHYIAEQTFAKAEFQSGCGDRRNLRNTPQWPMSVLTGFLVISMIFSAVSSQSDLLPSWITKPENRTVKLGNSTSLPCRVKDAAGRSLAWSRNGLDGISVLFINNSRFQSSSRYYTTSTGDGDSALFLTLISKEDDAVFQCGVQNSNLSASAQVTVLVNPGIPLISLNTTDDGLLENTFVQFRCDSLDGNPTSAMKWFRNGVPLPNVMVVPPATKFGTTSGVVVWRLSRDDFGANFTCTAENKEIPNSLVSNSTVLWVKYAPVLSLGPFDPLAVLVNSSLSLFCNVSAYPQVAPSSVQWYKDGQLIRNGTTFTLPSASVSDAGVYVCSARNFETRTTNISIDVQYSPRPPTFRVFQAVEGFPSNLTVVFDANPPVNLATMKWYNGSTLVSTGGFFVLPTVTRYDSRNYTVEATNALLPSGGAPSTGLGRASFQLRVSYRPGRATITVPSPIIVGQTVEITCRADNLGDPVGDLFWSRVGKNGTSYSNGTSLRIRNAQLDDIGNCSCVAVNDVGSGPPDTAFIDIYEPAKWILPMLPTKSEALVNGTLDGILCTAKGRPAPTIEWFKDGDRVDQDRFQVVNQSTASDFKWNTTSLLKWEGSARTPLKSSLRPEDAGVYSCQVSTVTNQRINQTIEIIIIYPPLMSTEMNPIGFDPELPGVMDCPARGFPFPSFTWFSGTATIENDDTYTIETSNGGSRLKIAKMVPSLVGIYRCRATNSMGSATMTFNLTLNSVPSSVTQLKVVSTTWESIELNWIPGYDGGIPQVFRIYFQSKTAPVDAGNSSRFNITGLNPNTTYLLSVVPKNRLGSGANSNNISQPTDAFVVPAPIDVKYRKESKTLTCRIESSDVGNFCLQLHFNASNNLRQNYTDCDLQPDAKVELGSVLPGTDPDAIKVSVCLKRRLDICSNPQSAEFVTSDDLPVRVIIIVCCVCGGFLVVLLILIVALCCFIRRKRQQSYSDEQRTINAFEFDQTQSKKQEQELGNSRPFYAAGIDNPALHQMEPQPTILYGTKGPYIDLYPLDRSDSHGSYGSDSGVSVSEVPKTKRIIHEIVV